MGIGCLFKIFCAFWKPLFKFLNGVTLKSTQNEKVLQWEPVFSLRIIGSTLHSFSLAEPGAGVIQKIVGNIFVYAIPAQMDEQHSRDLSKDQQPSGILTAEETPVRRVFLVKLVELCVIIFFGHVLYL